MLLLWISIGMFLCATLAFLTMLGLWTYSDAKVRSDKPEIWTLIVLLVPNFIGLIIYLLIGRTKKFGDSISPRNKFFLSLLACGILTILTLVATVILAIHVSIMCPYY